MMYVFISFIYTPFIFCLTSPQIAKIDDLLDAFSSGSGEEKEVETKSPVPLSPSKKDLPAKKPFLCLDSSEESEGMKFIHLPPLTLSTLSKLTNSFLRITFATSIALAK